MDLFRGYVRTKNKKCIDKFKDKELRSFEEVKDLDEYAGIIAKDVVLIDIDNAEQAEIMMNIVEDLQLDCRVFRPPEESTSSSKIQALGNVKTNRSLLVELMQTLRLAIITATAF